MLVLVNTLLVVTAGLCVWRGTDTDKILRVPASQVKVPALRLEPPTLHADFAGLVSRTPFYATRRLYVIPSKPEAPPPPVPKYVFGGSVIRPHGPAVALLNNPSNGSALRVTAGKDLDGWRVETVEASRVVLRYENERAEIARVARQPSQSGTAEGMSRVRLTNASRTQSSGGVHLLGSGAVLGSRETVGHVTPAAANLPPLAGSGSESIYIPPPPR